MKFEFGMRRKSRRAINVDGLGRRCLELLIAFFAVFLMGSQAQAGCNFSKALANTVVNFPATIYVKPNVPANTVISTMTVAVTGATSGLTYGTCNTVDSLLWMTGPYYVGSANRINPTSVQGIGYTAYLSDGGFSGKPSLDSQISPTSISGTVVSGSTATLRFPSQLYVTVNLVATGASITQGKLTLNPGTNGDNCVSPTDCANGTPGVAAVFAGTASVNNLFSVIVPNNATTIASPACSVTTPSPTVTLNPLARSALTGVGSTAGSGAVNIGLICTAAASKVLITLTDSVNPANVSNILSVKPGSTASGVALQILDPSGNPVLYGPDSSIVGNTNQWLVGTSTVGPMNIPLTVRYVQTEATVQPGTVSGVATFTMAYQ